MSVENKSFPELVVSVNKTGLYDVTAKGFAADNLTRDEALGCLASWIYGSRDTGSLPQFMRKIP